MAITTLDAAIKAAHEYLNKHKKLKFVDIAQFTNKETGDVRYKFYSVQQGYKAIQDCKVGESVHIFKQVFRRSLI